MKERKNNKGEIDLLHLCGVLWRRALAILLAALAGGILAFLWARFIVTPQYSSSVLLYVNNSYGAVGSAGFTINSSELSAAQSLVDTYIVILGTPETLDAVIDRTGVDYTHQELASMLSAEAVNSTEIFRITVRSPDAEEAALLVNAIADVLPGQISDVVAGSSVRVVSRGRVSTLRAFPSYANAAIMGIILGSILGCAAAVVLDLFDNIIHKEEYLTETYGLPVLAAIPDRAGGGAHSRGKKEQGMLREDLDFAAAESYKLLRTKLFFALPAKPCRVVGVTSSIRGEGKTTTAINLSRALAETGKRVLLMDADLRLSNVAGRLGVEGAPGLCDLLAGLCDDLGRAVRASKRLDNWSILPAGDLPPNPSELLGSEEMEKLMEQLVKEFDFIVVDMSPVNVVTDAIVTSRYTDGTMVVARQDYTDRRSLDRCVKYLKVLEPKLMGFVLTDAHEREKGYGKYGYGTAPDADCRG